MKKTFMLGFGLAAVALMAACSDENGFNKGSNAEGIVFTSSISTRATDTSFEGGDQIGISMTVDGGIVASNVQYGTEDGQSFTSPSPLTYGLASGAASVGFLGVYPYSANVSGGVYSFTLSTDAGTPLTKNDIMHASTPGIAVNTKTVPLDFSHKLVKIVMKLSDASGAAVEGANLAITNQQVAGTLNLTDGTVSATDAATSTMPFAANADISGEYQAIVMPSPEPVQGRCITIENGDATYNCPLDQEVFEPGKKYTFTVTLNANGTLEEGEPITVVPSVTDWTPERVEKGWILTGEINVLGKTALQLAANVAVTAEGTPIGDFEGELNADDVYSLSYTREDATNAVTLLVAPKNGGLGYSYTLPAGKEEGKLLIAVGDDKKQGINVSSEATGIMLTDVTVYTSTNVSVPMVIWTGDGTPGNGSASAEETPGYEPCGWRKLIAQITLDEQQRALFVPGASLRFHYSADFSKDILLLGHSHLSGSNWGTFDTENHTLTTVITYPMYEEVKNNNYVVPLVMDWAAITGTLNSVELIPADAEHGNLMWISSTPCMMDDYGRIITDTPSDLVEGDIIRVHCQDVTDGAKIGAYSVTWSDSGEVLTPLSADQNVAAGSSTYDYVLDAAAVEAFLAQRQNVIAITWIGSGMTVSKMELVRGGAGE